LLVYMPKSFFCMCVVLVTFPFGYFTWLDMFTALSLVLLSIPSATLRVLRSRIVSLVLLMYFHGGESNSVKPGHVGHHIMALLIQCICLCSTYLHSYRQYVHSYGQYMHSYGQYNQWCATLMQPCTFRQLFCNSGMYKGALINP
jgi:hypothetical protein